MAKASKRLAELWAEQIEIDYYAAFIKSWIAFNAWMNYKYGDINDTEKLKRIIDSSTIKDTVCRSIREQNKADTLLVNIAKLHDLLENKSLKNKDKQVSLSSVKVSKSPTNTSEIIRGVKFTFKCECGKNKCFVENKKGEKLLDFIDNAANYNKDKLEEKLSESRLSETQKQYARTCYEQLATVEEVNLLASSSEYYEIGSFRFIKNEQYIFKALMETIYDIRCMLFHGNIDPDDHKDIYEQAYYIVRSFIENLY